MGNNDKSVGEKVVEATTEVVDEAVEQVAVSKEWFEAVTARLERAERPVLVKVKDAVLSHKRQLVLGATTVAALGAAAYAVTHKDEVFAAVEHTTEVAAEGVELTAQDVKKTARQARTGSTTK